MKIRFEESFVNSLTSKLEYIAKDNPLAAREFSKKIISACKETSYMSYKHRKSIYHDDENIRDLIFRGS